MNPVKEFYLLTSDLISLLDEDNSGQEAKLEKINELLDRREKVLKNLEPPFTEGETAVVKQALALNEKLIWMMKEKQKKIKQELTAVKNKRKIRNGYIHSLQPMQTDGYFYDKRK